MGHRRIQNQLSAYLDNELSAEEHAVIGAHLSSCDECVEMLADFQQNRQWVVALEHREPPIADLVLPRLPDRGTVRHKFLPNIDQFWSGPFRSRFARPATGSIFALVGACLILAFIYFKPTQAPEDSLDLYFTVHAEHSVYNPSQSDANDRFVAANPKTPGTTVEDDTDFLLEVYLGDYR